MTGSRPTGARPLLSALLGSFVTSLIPLLAADCVSLRFGFQDGGIRPEHTPFLAITADVNGDGVADFISGNDVEGTPTLSVYLTRADGTFDTGVFEEGRELEAGRTLEAMLAVDLDGDGDLDLATANRKAILTFTNRGGGQFDGAFEAAPQTDARAVAAGEVTGDGKVDLIVANTAEDMVSVLAQQSDGGFVLSKSFVVGDAPVAVTLEDLDGDDALDLVVANRTSKQVSILLGNGEGDFAEAVHYGVGGSAAPIAVTIADLTGDDQFDVLVTTRSKPALLPGGGDGTFAEPIVFPDPEAAIAVVDVDGDGDLDLATPQIRSRTVNVLRNDGVGRFDTVDSFFVGLGPRTVNAVDLDSDGDVELIVTAQKPDRILTLWGAEPSRLAFSNLTVPLNGTPHGATTGDLNSDGIVDVITVNGHDRTVSVVLIPQEGEPTETQLLAIGAERGRPGGHFISVVTGDFDADGDRDVVTSDHDENEYLLLLNSGDGTLRLRSAFPTSERPFMAMTADLDGDGDLDLANVGWTRRVVSVVLNDGQGNFGEHRDFEVGGVNPVALVGRDFDGDGDVDLATANPTSRDVSFLYNQGDGSLSEATVLPVLGQPQYLVSEDFDGDGDFDVVAANTRPCDATVFSNQGVPDQGDGAFVISGAYPIDKNAYSMTTGDVDGDGVLDLVVGLQTSVVAVLLGRGDGTFEAVFEFGVAGQARFALTGDFNDDGRLDMVSANRTSRNLTFLFHEVSQKDLPMPCGEVAFQRGDVDADGTTHLTDGVFLLDYLFLRGTRPPCLKGADANDDGTLNLVDAVSLLTYLFTGREASPPVEPFSACGNDPTPDALDCESFPPCGNG
jgi:hypothetical protein